MFSSKSLLKALVVLVAITLISSCANNRTVKSEAQIYAAVQSYKGPF